MKRINEYRKLYEADANTDLKELKKTYRGLVKQWHPDKFQDGDAKAEEAEIKSRQIVDAYHFLVSISPETKAANAESYKETIEKSTIKDFQLKKQVLEVIFKDGTTYEYFGVTQKVYQDLINSDKQMRFARRKIFNSFLYRKSKADAEVAAV